MKALYLDGRGGLSVRLDGPALRVRRAGRADGRYPLPRIARVVAIGEVNWRPDALKACLKEQKPIAVLDGRGRFVRLSFELPGRQYGLARHMGDLLGVPRFRQRYLNWQLDTEREEMRKAAASLHIYCRGFEPDSVWQAICFGQHRRWNIRPGHYYRYLVGAAAAQIASVFSFIGMPRDPGFWSALEYCLFCGFLRLERWNLAVVLEELLAAHGGRAGRREITAAFEAGAAERDTRVEFRRRSALLAMTGIRPARASNLEGRNGGDSVPAQLHRDLIWFCEGVSRRDGKPAPAADKRLVRKSVRLLRAHLIQDRRLNESQRKA